MDIETHPCPPLRPSGGRGRNAQRERILQELEGPEDPGALPPSSGSAWDRNPPSPSPHPR